MVPAWTETCRSSFYILMCFINHTIYIIECISWDNEVFDTTDARCNHEDSSYYLVTFREITPWTVVDCYKLFGGTYGFDAEVEIELIPKAKECRMFFATMQLAGAPLLSLLPARHRCRRSCRLCAALNAQWLRVLWKYRFPQLQNSGSIILKKTLVATDQTRRCHIPQYYRKNRIASDCQILTVVFVCVCIFMCVCMCVWTASVV